MHASVTRVYRDDDRHDDYDGRTRLYLYARGDGNTRASVQRDGRKNEKNGWTGKVAEPQSEAPTSCGKNGHGAIMFLLGFISKRVINYTSKYNDDDEGHDDIRYWIYIHVRVVCVYIRRSIVCELPEPSRISPF